MAAETTTAAATVRDGEDAITREVLARYAGTTDPRLREIMLSLVKHIHGFARDVRLSWDEWLFAMNYLVKAGQFCQGGRHEFAALSALVGLETLVLEISNPKPPGATLPSVLGPFFVPNAPTFPNGADLANGAKGEPLFVSGRVLDADRRPISGAVIDIWHSDERGLYDVQGDLAKDGMWARGQLKSEPDGRYWFWTVMPTAYPAPMDGAMGDIFKNTSNIGWRPAHVHVSIHAQGHDALTTAIFVRGSKYLDEDTAFGVRPGLIADYVQQGPGKAPDGRQMDLSFRTLDYDFVLTKN